MADSYYLLPPKQQKFYRILALCSTFNAVGKQTWWGYNPPRFNKISEINSLLESFLAPTYFLLQIGYLLKNYSDLTFNVRGILFAIIPATYMVNLSIFSAKQDSFKKIMKQFMGKIHVCNLGVEDDFVIKKRIQAEKRTRFTAFFVITMLMLDYFAMLICTGLNNYHYREEIRNKTMRLETVLYALLPFDYVYNFRNWLIVHTFNAYLVWSGTVIVALHTSTNYPFMFQLISHIEILRHRIQTEFKGSFTQEEIRKKLIDIIKYHNFVLEIFDDIQNGFGFNITGFYFYNLVADSLNMYQLMMGDRRSAPIYAFMLLVYAGSLVMMSFVLEEIRRQSDDLADAVYDIDWESMSESNKPMVLMLLMRTQPALEFTAMGGFKAGVKPMISIGRTSFSIYVMLKEK